MSRKRAILVVISVFIVVLGVEGFHLLRDRRERAKCDRLHQAAFASLSKDVKAGMNRQQVETILCRKTTSFTQRSGNGTFTFDDVITLDRRKSPLWFCNYDDTVIRIIFEKSSRSSAYYDIHPDDVVKTVTLEREPQQCL